MSSCSTGPPAGTPGSVDLLTNFVNEVYTDAERGLWRDGTSRTSTVPVYAIRRSASRGPVTCQCWSLGAWARGDSSTCSWATTHRCWACGLLIGVTHGRASGRSCPAAPPGAARSTRRSPARLTFDPPGVGANRSRGQARVAWFVPVLAGRNGGLSASEDAGRQLRLAGPTTPSVAGLHRKGPEVTLPGAPGLYQVTFVYLASPDERRPRELGKECPGGQRPGPLPTPCRPGVSRPGTDGRHDR